MQKILRPKQEWTFVENPVIPANMKKAINAPDMVIHTLIKRGITDAHQAIRFLDYSQYIATSPSELPDLDKGVERIVSAIKSQQNIGIWGDFDVDGQTATAVLVSALRQTGANVKYHLPIRSSESHGIKLTPFKEFLETGVDLILTCDTGISAYDAIDYAQSKEIDVIITDHHLLPETLPRAFALINPGRLTESHPLSSLSGVGTAFKFVESLLEKTGYNDYSKTLHDLVALGSIADLAQLIGDTRYLVQSGISQIRSSPRPSLLAMLQASEVVPERISEEHISFVLAPRLNAIGRISDANPMVEFLLTENPEMIAVTVNMLEGLNTRRKILCDQVFDGALALIERNPSLLDQPVLILEHPEWPAGVVGIVASRLVEMFHKPVILFVADPSQPLRGSARSVEGIDITAAITLNSGALLSFGGHPMAAGLSLEAENFPAFQYALNRTVQSLNEGRELKHKLIIDQFIQPTSFSLDLVHELEKLAPFGPGNRPLIFAAKQMRILEMTPVGRLEEHIQLVLKDKNENESKYIWWNGADLPFPEGTFDLAYSVRSSNYRGQEQIQFEWIDFKQDESSIFFNSNVPHNKIINFDYRLSPDPYPVLDQLQKQTRLEIWNEGSGTISLVTVDRFSLVPSENLIIWSIPPNNEILGNIIRIVKPKKIYWFLISPDEHNLQIFLMQLGKLLKQGSQIGQKAFSVDHLAAQTASTASLVLLGLRWHSCMGNITFNSFSNEQIEIQLGGAPNAKEVKSVQQSLIQSFEEIRAFSAYLRRIDLDTLTTELG